MLFERLFAQSCSAHLSHLDEQAASPLNVVCYMWWDLFPHHGRPDNQAYAELDAELLDVMRRILALNSLACQESALHGLGHWKWDYPGFVREAIDQFLAQSRELRAELRAYATYARLGQVL